MKVAAKLIVLLTLAVTAVTVLSSYFSSKQFLAGVERQHQLVADVLLVQAAKPEFRQAMRKADHLYFRRQAAPLATDLEIRWVWLDERAPTSARPIASEASLPRQNLKEPMSFQRNEGDGMSALHSYFPVVNSDNSRVGAIEITSRLAQVYVQGRQIWFNALITIGSLALLSVAMVMTAGVRWIARPLERINKKMKQVGEGDFTSDLEVHSRDELGRLAASVNQMCDRLRLQQSEIVNETQQKILALDQLRHADRLKTVGELAAGVAHEVGTPLNVISGRASMLIENSDMSDEQVRRNAQAIKSESERISNIVNKLLHFARRQPSMKQIADIRDVILHATDLLGPLAEKKEVRLHADLGDESAKVEFDFGKIQQVLMNLIDNAVDVSPPGSQVTISLEWIEREEVWRIRVSDEGPGIPEEYRGRIFEPFFTTKDTGRGTGLGLSIAHGIMEEHGGKIELDPSQVNGSSFTIDLPLDFNEEVAESIAASKSIAASQADSMKVDSVTTNTPEEPVEEHGIPTDAME